MNGFMTTGGLMPSLDAEIVATIEQLRSQCFAALCRDYNPIGFAESLNVRELSRHAAQMIRDDRFLTNLQEQSQKILAFVLNPGSHPESTDAAMTNISADGVGSLAREARENANAFFLRLRDLRQLQENRHRHVALLGPDSRFAAEPQCVAYLARRFALGSQTCRTCRASGNGWFIAARRCWECECCRTQTCLRHGTVMARSRLPLLAWFQAIRLVLFQPNIGAADLGAAINIRRGQTAARILAKIRVAMLANNASQLLADLDNVYLNLS
jgi:hypothetical protein